MYSRIWPGFLLFISSTVLASPNIQHWQTGQGINVYLVETHEIPMLDIQVIFDAGSSRDKNNAGLAVLTNELLAEGAAGLTADDISRNFENQGSVYGNSAGYDSAAVSLRSIVDPDKLHPALKNLKRVIDQPDFPLDAFERLRNQMLIGIRHKQQSPGQLASEAFFAALYGDHPYAYPSEGTVESLEGITREKVISFHKKYYVAANAMVVMVGDINKQQAQQLADDLMADLPIGETAPALPDVSAQTEARQIHIDHPSTQTHVLIGQLGIRRDDPDYFPLYVGNHILGGSGMVSRLFEEVREKRGLSYTAYSYFSPMRKSGPFTAGLQTKAGQTQEAISVVNEQLLNFIENGPTEEELVASKKNITGGYPLRIDSNNKIIGYLAMIGFYGLPLDYLETFNRNVESVTVDQIKDAFSRRLSPDKFVTVLVGPGDVSTGETN